MTDRLLQALGVADASRVDRLAALIAAVIADSFGVDLEDVRGRVEGAAERHLRGAGRGGERERLARLTDDLAIWTMEAFGSGDTQAAAEVVYDAVAFAVSHLEPEPEPVRPSPAAGRLDGWISTPNRQGDGNRTADVDDRDPGSRSHTGPPAGLTSRFGSGGSGS